MALAAACALLGACASEAVTPHTALEYRPAPRSSLVSSPDIKFFIARSRQGVESATILASQQAGAAPRPVARLVQVRQGPDSQVSVQRLREGGRAAGRADHEMAVLAQIYTLVLRQDPLARYCIGDDGPPCDARREGVSHARVLQALADARARVAGRATHAPAWRLVEVRAAATPPWDADLVGVRVTSREAPLEGVSIFFDRAPHSICQALTSADGVAACRLVDQHGDEHEHDHAAPVVVTFPGDRRDDEVLLPTTHVLQTPAFALRRPFVLPRKQ